MAAEPPSAPPSVHAPARGAGREAAAVVVTVAFADLVNEADLDDQIEAAFGMGGLGLIIVSGVPDLPAARAACLPLAHALATLPPAELARYEHAASSYSFGWSRGKEMLSDGVFDTAKGSFYANPSFDEPFTDAALVAAFPSFAHPNVWPDESVHLPGFRAGFRALGGLCVSTGALLAARVDAYVSRRLPGYAAGSLEEVVRTSRVAKGRLLYYFPAEKEAPGVVGPEAPGGDDTFAWCGWHNDHGSLTGLASAMYVDAATGAEVPCPDARAGLYVRARTGETVRCSIPADCLGFQIGETACVHSGGLLQATPHAVRAPTTPGVARATLAVFMEPEWGAPMDVPAGADTALVTAGSAQTMLPAGMPPLAGRWEAGGGQTFGEFTARTLAAYY